MAWVCVNCDCVSSVIMENKQLVEVETDRLRGNRLFCVSGGFYPAQQKKYGCSRFKSKLIDYKRFNVD